LKNKVEKTVRYVLFFFQVSLICHVKKKRKKKKKGQSYLLCIARRDSMDLDDVLAVLFFISLCCALRGEILWI
jgi:hypothetical protein